MLGTPGAPGLPVQCTHTHTAPHTDAHTKHANTQNIQSHKPIHAHNYKSLYVHTNACVRTHGHPSKYAHTCSYTKPHIHVITPTKHTGAHSYTQKCTNVCHLRMHTKRTHSPSLSLSPSLCPRQARSPGVPSGGWAGSTCGRKAPTSVCVSRIGSVCCVCRSARRALLGYLLHWLSAGRSRAPLPTAAPLPAWSPTFLSAPRACSPGLGNLFTAAREQAGRGAQLGHLLVSVLGLSFSDCDPEGWFLGVPRILHCPEPTSLLHKEPKP